MARTIADVGEVEFLSGLLPRLHGGPGLLVGPGQDCAVVGGGRRRWLFTVDALVEGVHFRPGWLSPRQVGRKSFLVNASDVAAMGGQPRFCVVSLGVPFAYPVRDLFAVQAGIGEAARGCGACVVGGNLSRAKELFISIALLAVAPTRTVTREGARAGDRVYVTGNVGDAALAVRLMSRARRQGLRQPLRERLPRRLLHRFAEPSPRLRAGRLLVETGVVSAMIDVSDGLVRDLEHICAESRVGAVIDVTRVPLSPAYRAANGTDGQLALHGGEDYELLCTVPERNVKRLERIRARLGCPISWIGRVTAEREIQLAGKGGATVQLPSAGFDHFRSHA